MAAINDVPTFNLKAVIHETGLKPDTLRAWERRYGLPQPKRTGGGHRLYSQRDIDMLKWLIARQEEGLSISRAVALWRRLEMEGQDPLQVPAYSLPESAPVAAYAPDGESIAELREEWLSACLDFDGHRAEQVLTYALALYPAELVCFEILLKCLEEVGEGWYSGDVTVQQEHFTAELAVRRLEALVAATPAPTRPGRILIGCAPEEQHTVAPLLLTFLLRQRGWDVVYLGARVPAARLETALDSVRPQLVILTAHLLTTAAGLLEAAQLLDTAGVPFAFGGRIFSLIPSLRERIPGHFMGDRLETAPQMVEQLLKSPSPPPPTRYASEAYRAALAQYRRRRILIEGDVWRSLGTEAITPAHITIANDALARNITAALTLGDIGLLGTDIEWVEGFLDYRGLNGEILSRYLDAYYRAAQSHLDETSHPVVEWLARVTARQLEKRATNEENR